MAIRQRQGLKKDMDANKLLPGELAVPLDSKEVYVCFAPGNAQRMATHEAMKEQIADATKEVGKELAADLSSAVSAAQLATQGANKATEDAKTATTKTASAIASAEDINSQNTTLYERLKNTDVSALQDKIVPVNISNLTININDYNYAKGYEVGKWKCISTSGAANITGLPGNKDSFLLTLDTPRANNNLDYVQIQTIYYAYNKTIYQRWCTNGTYTAWVLISTGGVLSITNVPISLITGATMVATVDWNNYIQGGFFRGENLLHSPPVTNGSHAWWHVTVLRHNDAWFTQIANDFNGKATYRRARVNSVWGDWVLMLDANTAKDVLGIQPGTTADITLDIPITGLQTTIDSLPKIINHSVTINVTTGTIAENIKIENFKGTGTLNIKGASAYSTYTHVVSRITLEKNTLSEINIRGFTATTTSPAFYVLMNTGVTTLTDCNAITGYGVGFHAYHNPGVTTCVSCTANNRSEAFYAYNSRMTLNTTYGSGNNIVLRSHWGGYLVHITSTNAAGTTAYQKTNGGMIVSSAGVFL